LLLAGSQSAVVHVGRSASSRNCRLICSSAVTKSWSNWTGTKPGSARFGDDVRVQRSQIFQQIGKQLVVAVVVNVVPSHDVSPLADNLSWPCIVTNP
jgi:hypothetical protein